MPPTDARSRLFHAIVVVGAALGSACGGATAPERQSQSLDASNDDAERDAGTSQPAESAPSEDAAAEAAADAAFARDAAIAPDAGICDPPASNGTICTPPDARVPGCCVSNTGCFPCYV